MPYAGHTLLGREAASYLFKKWQNQDERIKALATMFAESRLSVGAWNDNLGEGQAVLSRDCGLYQINIPVEQLDTRELLLRSESQDPAEWEPVVRYNVGYARSMWESRKWQPWVAYTTGWATFPEWWVWRQVDQEPVGPWVPTGRYLQKSILGWANFHLIVHKDKTPEGALAFAKKMQKRWEVKGELGLRPNAQHQMAVAWLSFPPKPEAEPADGVGPRPIPNSGQ